MSDRPTIDEQIAVSTDPEWLRRQLGVSVPSADGRHARAERTKAEILTACRTMMLGGNFRPSIAAVAKAAGRSVRAVFEHFGTVETLHREAIADQTVRASILARFTGDADRSLEAAVFGKVA